MEGAHNSLKGNELRVLVLAAEGSSFHKFDPASGSIVQDRSLPSYTTASLTKFSPLGTMAAICDDQGIHIVDMKTRKERVVIKKEEVSNVRFSPLENYLVSCTKYNKNTREANLLVWDTKDGSLKASFEWQRTSKQGPKNVKFTANEQFCAILTGKNSITIFANHNFDKPFTKLSQAPKINKKGEEIKNNKNPISYKYDGFAWCPQPANMPKNTPLFFIAWQNADIDGQGGTVIVYDLTNKPDKPKFQIACEKAQEIIPKFSRDGYALLIWSQNFTDSTGKSYYGEHELLYSQIYGGKARSQVPVFNGQILDIAWSPKSDYFIVISGMQPATATLYSKDASPLFEFGKRYRNTIRFSPFSHAVLVGGFGNLAGEMDFWNLDDKK